LCFASSCFVIRFAPTRICFSVVPPRLEAFLNHKETPPPPPRCRKYIAWGRRTVRLFLFPAGQSVVGVDRSSGNRGQLKDESASALQVWTTRHYRDRETGWHIPGWGKGQYGNAMFPVSLWHLAAALRLWKRMARDREMHVIFANMVSLHQTAIAFPQIWRLERRRCFFYFQGWKGHLPDFKAK